MISVSRPRLTAFVVIVLCLALTGCPSIGTPLVLALDAVSIAANLAVPFAGSYGPFVALVAQAASASAMELTTADPTSLQLSKILNTLEGLVSQYPALANASPQTVAVIMAIEVAVQAVITLIHNQQKTAVTYAATSPAHAAKVKAAAAVPIPLNNGDAKKLLKIFKTDSATLKALAAR